MKWMQNWKNWQENREKEFELKPLVIWGPAGSGKSSIVRVVSSVCNYIPFVINASAERNGKDLLNKVKQISEQGSIF